MTSEPIDIIINLFVWTLVFAFVRHCWKHERSRRRNLDKPKDPIRPIDVSNSFYDPTNEERIGRWHLKGGLINNRQEKENGGPLTCVLCDAPSSGCRCIADLSKDGRRLRWHQMFGEKPAPVRFTLSPAAFSPNENPGQYNEPLKAASLHCRDATVFPFTPAERERLRQRKKGPHNHAKKTDTG